jgi:peptidoglycan/LPS O-acetylase OafA/YrhL
MLGNWGAVTASRGHRSGGSGSAALVAGTADAHDGHEAPDGARARAGRSVAPFRLAHRPALDGLRGLGVVIVTAAHLGEFLWPEAKGWFLYPGGVVGVDLFFALSGFLITALLVGEVDRHGRVRLASFLWRRVLRLSPALVVVVGVVFLAACTGVVDNPVVGQAKRSVWTVLYLQVWQPVDHMAQPELTHTWSLAVEMHFYLLWSATAAAVALVLPRRARPALAVAAAGLVALVAVTRSLRFGDGATLTDLYFTTPSRLDEPLVGSIGGLAFASGWLDRLPPRAFAAAAVGGVAGIAWLSTVVDPFTPWPYRGGLTLVAAVATVAVVGAAGLAGGRARRLLACRPLAGLGLCSYSVYLWHLPVFIVLSRATPAWPSPARAATGLAVTAALSAATYLGIERPAQRYRRRVAGPAVMVVRGPGLTVDVGTGIGAGPATVPGPAAAGAGAMAAGAVAVAAAGAACDPEAAAASARHPLAGSAP